MVKIKSKLVNQFFSKYILIIIDVDIFVFVQLTVYINVEIKSFYLNLLNKKKYISSYAYLYCKNHL